MSAPPVHYDLAGVGANGCAVYVPNPVCVNKAGVPGDVPAWDARRYGERAVLKLPFKSHAREQGVLELVNRIDPEHAFTVASVRCEQSPDVLRAAVDTCVRATTGEIDSAAYREIIDKYPSYFDMLMQDGGVELTAHAMLSALVERRQNFTPLELLEAFIPLFHGARVMAEHPKKIVHMDIKPQNVLIEFKKSGSDRVRLNIVDFGNARSMFKLISDSLTDPSYPYYPAELMLADSGLKTVFTYNPKTYENYYFASYERLVYRVLSSALKIRNECGTIEHSAPWFVKVANMLLFRNDWTPRAPTVVGNGIEEYLGELREIQAMLRPGDESAWRATFLDAHRINVYGVGATMLESMFEIMYAVFKTRIGEHYETAYEFMLQFVKHSLQFIHPIPWMRKTEDAATELKKFCLEARKKSYSFVNLEANIDMLIDEYQRKDRIATAAIAAGAESEPFLIAPHFSPTRTPRSPTAVVQPPVKPPAIKRARHAAIRTN